MGEKEEEGGAWGKKHSQLTSEAVRGGDARTRVWSTRSLREEETLDLATRLHCKASRQMKRRQYMSSVVTL